MPDFPACSNLCKNVASVIIGEKYRNLLEAPLNKLSIDVFLLPDNPLVDRRLSGHADLSVFYSGYDTIFLAPYLRETLFAEMIENLGLIIEFLDIIQSAKYPNDAQMNICTGPDYLIYNPSVSSAHLINYLTNIYKTAIPVRQGYVKCCTCVTGERSIITSDNGIAKACFKHGFDVLQIENGGVELEGFDYGFIGGSSFMIKPGKIAFTGNLDMHPDKKIIFDYLEKRQIEPVFLTSQPIFDIGSFIPLTEKQP